MYILFRMKKDAWSKIENEFNCHCIDNPRTSLTLKHKYENIKRQVKKQYADEKSYHTGTGGGPSKSFSYINPTIVSSIGDMLQNKMTGEPSVYDSDKPNEILEMSLKDTKVGHISGNDDDVDNTVEDVITVDFSDAFCDKVIEEKTVDGKQ